MLLYFILPSLLIILFLLLEYKFGDGINAEAFFHSTFIFLLGLVLAVFINFLYLSIVRSPIPDLAHTNQVIINDVELLPIEDNYYITRTIDNYYTFSYDSDIGILSDKSCVVKSFIKYINENETPRFVSWYTESKSKFINSLIYTKTHYYTYYIPEDSIFIEVDF